MPKLHLKAAAAWPGAILHTIANAVSMIYAPLPLAFCGWRDTNYWVNNMGGKTGALLFSFSPSPRVVGGFFDAKSERSPYLSPKDYDLDFILRGMPAEHRALLDAGRPYFERLEGTDVPCITAAFWDEGEYLAAAEPWEVLLAHGAGLVRVELLEDHDEALKEWSGDFGLTQKQESFVRKLFKRRMAQPEGTIELSPREAAWLVSTSDDPEDEGVVACRTLLAKIGIRMP
jgi:hypothetical protein